MLRSHADVTQVFALLLALLLVDANVTQLKGETPLRTLTFCHEGEGEREGGRENSPFVDEGEIVLERLGDHDDRQFHFPANRLHLHLHDETASINTKQGRLH